MMFSSTKSVLIPLALHIALHAASSTAQLVVDWSSYPGGAVNCLNGAQSSAKCPSDTVANFNGCVCKNGNGFLQSAATCLGSSDPGDVAGVYNTLNTNCGGTGDPLNINLAQWNSWASPAPGSTTPAGGTTAPPVTIVTQAPATETLTAGLSNTVISTVTLQSSAGGSAKVSVITLTPGQSTTIPGIITVAGSVATSTAGASSSSSGSKLGVGAIAGIAVGGAVVIAVVGLIAVLLMRRRGPSNQPTTSSPAFAAAAVPPAAPMSDAGMGPSPGMAQVEPYKDRPVSSIPSTAASPDPTKQGPYAAPSPQMQQYGQPQQGYPQYPPGQYPPGQYPQGQYPQESPMQGYGQPQYAGPTYGAAPVPYGAQPPQQYVPHPGQQYSELHSEPAQGTERVELPGGPQ